MSPRARFSDIGSEAYAPVAAPARPPGPAPNRFQPATDKATGGRIDLLARRRRRHARRERRAQRNPASPV